LLYGWLIEKQSIKLLIARTLLLGVITALSFLVFFILFPDALLNLKGYFKIQLLAAITGQRDLSFTGFRHFYIFYIYLKDYIWVAITGVGAIALQARVSQQPLMKLLYRTDESFSQALEFNVNVQDSASIKELTIPNELPAGLNKLDSKGVIVKLLQYKQLKNESNLLSNVNLFSVLSDSLNVYQRANLIDDYKEKLVEQFDLIKEIENQIDTRTKLDFKLYLGGYQPSIEAYIDTEKTILGQKVEIVTKKSTEMANQIQFFSLEEDSIYITPMIAATRNGSKYILKTIETDSTVIMNGVWKKNPFVAVGGFDMKVINIFQMADSSFIAENMILLNGNLLLNLKSEDEEDNQQILYFLNPKLEELWRLEYEAENTVADAKIEAGIIFVYDTDGKVLKTLNSQGKEIGN
jgi:hypothetical protein